MTRKLAIVISGAVSLGSYEAGVTYELLEAIAKHNELARSEDRIEIDVITGASAGGMTATILAKSLLCHGPTLRDPYQNPLYKAWVEEVKMLRDNPDDMNEIPGLLEVDKEDHKLSLLNKLALDQIAAKVLPDQFSSVPGIPISDPHPAVSRDAKGQPQVLVGVAMGNLNGFPLSLRLNQGIGLTNTDDFSYSQYKDRYVVRMVRPAQEPLQDLHMEEWEEYKSSPHNTWKAREEEMSTVSWPQLREVALSSGAFPFAFGVRTIERHSDQKGQPRPEALYASRDSNRKQSAFQPKRDPFDGKYVYTDGGVFENEPIGLAMTLISSLYGESEIMNQDRYFLFIAPGARKADADPFQGSSNADHLSVAKALVAGIMGQSRYQDWIARNRHPKVLAVTSGDAKLLGDVFSAFAGFLEEKFRAYDYNIGRSTAQEKLKILLATERSPIRPDIRLEEPLWPPPKANRSKYWVKLKAETNPRTPMSWAEAQSCFQEIAAVQTGKDGRRDQIAELNYLLDNVDPSARKRIRSQILDRVRSLVGYLYLRYEKRPGQGPASSLRGLATTVGFWVKGAWALIRGRKAMEHFVADQADQWLRTNLHL